MKLRRSRAAGIGAVVAAVGVFGAPLVARAWDPATTQAGITEKALLSSSFHRVLKQRLGRSLGAFEPLALRSKFLPAGLNLDLAARLSALDPAGGHRPDADGGNSALAWVTAGAVLAETPPERGRNHFLQPQSGAGLDDAGGLSGTLHAVRLSLDGSGGVRGLATGTAFDLTGLPSLRWVVAPENDLGLRVFESSLESAVAAPEPDARETALVRALLALGGVLAALEDAGEPAHVRNDFRATYLRRQGPSGWDRGSDFERFVARAYGRSGVPASSVRIERPTFESFFAASDGKGLADRTQRRFFSEGTLPANTAVTAAMSPEEVRQMAAASLTWEQPALGRLELRGGTSEPRYLMRDKRRVLGYQRDSAGVKFFLDEAVYRDSAAVLLPEVVSYAAGLIDHLFRASVAVTVEGANVAVKLQGLRGAEAFGTLSLFAENQAGTRTRLGDAQERRLSDGESVAATIPSGTRRIGAVFRGKDAAGSVIAVGDLRIP